MILQHVLEWVDVLTTLVILSLFSWMARRGWKQRTKAMDELRKMHEQTHADIAKIWEKMK